MRRILSLGLMTALPLLLVSGSAAQDLKVEEGFKALFNGKNLDGWEYRVKEKVAFSKGETETPDARISVKEGAIVMNAKDRDGKGGIKDLYTTASFEKDFTLRLQFKAGEKADSGVYVRGPQIQIRDFVRRGEQKQLTKFKNDDWNDLEVIVKGTEMKVTVNGEEIKGAPAKIPARGGIGLQAESGVFSFRHVRIQEAK